MGIRAGRGELGLNKRLGQRVNKNQKRKQKLLPAVKRKVTNMTEKKPKATFNVQTLAVKFGLTWDSHKSASKIQLEKLELRQLQKRPENRTSKKTLKLRFSLNVTKKLTNQ